MSISNVSSVVTNVTTLLANTSAEIAKGAASNLTNATTAITNATSVANITNLISNTTLELVKGAVSNVTNTTTAIGNATTNGTLADVISHLTPEDGHTSDGHDSALVVGVLLLLVLIAGSMNLAHFLKHIKFSYLGESAVYIIVGLIISALWTSIAYDPTNRAIQLNSHFFSLVLLPPIIFEAGFTLQRTSFFQNILTILGLALVGAFYSTFVTSLLMWGFSQLGSTPWSFIESLVFGSLISSTDPVTVLSLLPSNVDKRLYMLIFGESALNDAVAIILYRFFTGLQSSGAVGVWPFFLSVFAAIGVFLGSFLVGVVVALIFAKITKHVWIEGYEGAIYEMIMLITFAYSSYLIAEICKLTGIISIFFCGIAMSHYAYSNLTPLTRRTMKVTIRMICSVFEGMIFLYLGLGLLSFGNTYSILLIFFAMIAILISRTHVFIICSLNHFVPGQYKIPLEHQTLMWFSGLRGAVAFALGVTFLDHPDFSQEIKKSIFGTTVMVVVMTVMIFGGLTPYMLKWLKIVKEEDVESQGHGGDQEKGHAPVPGSHEDAVKKESGGHGQEMSTGAALDASMDALAMDAQNEITEDDLKQPVFGWLYMLDSQYIRPYFSHNARDHIQVMEVIKRVESRRNSTISLKVLSPNNASSSKQVSHRGVKNGYNHIRDDDDSVPFVVSSPMEDASSKRGSVSVDTPGIGNGDVGERRRNEFKKSNTADEIALEAVSLN